MDSLFQSTISKQPDDTMDKIRSLRDELEVAHGIALKLDQLYRHSSHKVSKLNISIKLLEEEKRIAIENSVRHRRTVEVLRKKISTMMMDNRQRPQSAHVAPAIDNLEDFEPNSSSKEESDDYSDGIENVEDASKHLLILKERPKSAVTIKKSRPLSGRYGSSDCAYNNGAHDDGLIKVPTSRQDHEKEQLNAEKALLTIKFSSSNDNEVIRRKSGRSNNDRMLIKEKRRPSSARPASGKSPSKDRAKSNNDNQSQVKKKQWNLYV